MSNYKPFRLGRKQERVILNDEGLEVCIFNEKNKHLAPKVVDFLNEFVTGRKQQPLFFLKGLADAEEFFLKTKEKELPHNPDNYGYRGDKREYKQKQLEKAIESRHKLNEIAYGTKYDPYHGDLFPHLRIKVDSLRKKSELNVIKYRRKVTKYHLMSPSKTDYEIISELSSVNRKMRRCLNRILASTFDKHVKDIIDELFDDINHAKN